MEQVQGIISAQHGEAFRAYLPHRGIDIAAALSGRLRQRLKAERTSLVTGDAVLLDRQQDEGGTALILELLPRRSVLTRTEAGQRGRSQPLAANVDLVLICTSMNEEFNMKRLERYLALADGAGIQPVLLLTKADIAGESAPFLAELSGLRPSRRQIVCSALTGQGMEEVRGLLAGGKSGVLLGSSGVGKSSLVNAILGQERMHTARISAYQDKGRHTTTARELLPLPGGGCLIDTPGMRELKLDESDVESGFADIQALAVQCRFSDCRHVREPGCAVKQAVTAGQLTAGRLESFIKLRDEQQRRSARRTR